MTPSPEHIIILLAGLFAIAALFIIATTLLRRGQKQSNSDLWHVYAFEFLIVAVVLLPAYLGSGYLLAALLLFSLRAHREISKGSGLPFNALFLSSYVFSSVLFFTIVIHLLEPHIVQVLLLLSALITSAALYLTGHKRQREIWLLFLVLLSISCLLAVVEWKNGFLLLLFLYIITESNDSFAYLSGKLFGRKKLFPVISPQKTREGLLGGIIASMIIGLGLNYFFMNMPWLFILLVIGATIVSAVAGDLFFSVYKRSLGMKDFPAVIKKHGGVLDIYDSLLTASIVYYFLLLSVF